MPTHDQLVALLESTLRDKYCIDPLPEFSIVVEGTTDRDYMMYAVKLAIELFDEDLLRVPSHLSEKGTQIAIVTPINPSIRATDGRDRGGIKKMVPLATDLCNYIFFLNWFRGIVFVFDHDDAGLAAKKELEKLGYSANQHILTLDAKDHPASCRQKQVVIEDLLSFRIQHDYFTKGGTWCSVEYEAGNAKRFKWEHESKHALRDYVCSRATWSDVREIGRVIARARRVFGLPVNESLWDPV